MLRDCDIKITKEFLLAQGFEENYPIKGHEDFVEYVSLDGRITFSELSNMADRDWMVHVDNDHYETIGSLDVANLAQVKTFFGLCEYEYEWKQI